MRHSLIHNVVGKGHHEMSQLKRAYKYVFNLLENFSLSQGKEWIVDGDTAKTYFKKNALSYVKNCWSVMGQHAAILLQSDLFKSTCTLHASFQQRFCLSVPM